MNDFVLELKKNLLCKNVRVIGLLIQIGRKIILNTAHKIAKKRTFFCKFELKWRKLTDLRPFRALKISSAKMSRNIWLIKWIILF